MKSQQGSMFTLAFMLGIILFITLALIGWVDKFLYGWGIDVY